MPAEQPLIETAIAMTELLTHDEIEGLVSPLPHQHGLLPAPVPAPRPPKLRRASKSELPTYGGLESTDDMYAPLGAPTVASTSRVAQLATDNTHLHAIERMACVTRHRASFREEAAGQSSTSAATAFATPAHKTMGRLGDQPEPVAAWVEFGSITGNSDHIPMPAEPVPVLTTTPMTTTTSAGTTPPATRMLQWETLKVGDTMDRSRAQRIVDNAWRWVRPITSTMPWFSKLAQSASFMACGYRFYPLVPVDVGLRGMSQGLFVNNPVTGLLYWAAMLQADVWVGLMALLGLVVSSTFAWLLRMNRGFLHSGLYGFSGFITAATVAYFNAGGELPRCHMMALTPVVCCPLTWRDLPLTVRPYE